MAHAKYPASPWRYECQSIDWISRSQEEFVLGLKSGETIEIPYPMVPCLQHLCHLGPGASYDFHGCDVIRSEYHDIDWVKLQIDSISAFYLHIPDLQKIP